jgi:vacuolar-type H+-ATPase subunit H
MAFTLDINGFDIQKTFKTFATVKKLAPIAERTTGRFGTTMQLNGKLDEHMNPILPSLNGSGKLTTSGVIVENFPPLVKLADAIKMEQYKKLDVSNLNISYKFENGRVNVAPFDVNLGGIPTNISGSTGFDQTIDYSLAMNIPTSKLPSAASGAINSLITQANAKGANFSMAENVKMNVKVGGTIDKPIVSTGLKETSGALTNQLKDKAKEEVDKLKVEAEAKAREEADRLKKEATDKANAEADRLKKEAEAKAKAEADRLRKEAEKKAKEGLKNLFGK